MKKQKKVTPRRLEHMDSRHWRTLDVLITDNGAVNSRSAIWILRTAGCAHGDARALIDHKIKTGAIRRYRAGKEFMLAHPIEVPEHGGIRAQQTSRKGVRILRAENAEWDRLDPNHQPE